MVRCYKKDMSVKRCWLKGMILASTDDTFKAVVRMNDDEKTLAIDVYAKNGVDAKPYVLFKLIRDQVLEINGKLGLTAKEVIVCGEDSFSVKTLLNSYENHIDRVSGDETDRIYSPAELLGRFFEPVQGENGEIMYTFNVDNRKVYVNFDNSQHNSALINGKNIEHFNVGSDGRVDHHETVNRKRFGGN
jgi:hypothetical protein